MFIVTISHRTWRFTTFGINEARNTNNSFNVIHCIVAVQRDYHPMHSALIHTCHVQALWHLEQEERGTLSYRMSHGVDLIRTQLERWCQSPADQSLSECFVHERKDKRVRLIAFLREHRSAIYLGCGRGFGDQLKPKKLDWSEFPQVKWPTDQSYPRFVFLNFGTVGNVEITTSGTPTAARPFILRFSGLTSETRGYKQAYFWDNEICKGNELNDVENRPVYFGWLDPNYPA